MAAPNQNQSSAPFMFLNSNGQDLSQFNFIASSNQSQMMLNDGATASDPNDQRMKQVVDEAAPFQVPTAANMFTTLHPQHQHHHHHHFSTAHQNFNSVNGVNDNNNNVNGQQTWQQQIISGIIVDGQSLSSQLTCPMGQTSHHHPTQTDQIIHFGEISQYELTQKLFEMTKTFKSFTAFLLDGKEASELNALVRNHGDQLRRTLSDMASNNYASFVGAAEERVLIKLQEKETQLQQMMRNNADLQKLAVHFRHEAQINEARIRSLEKVVMSLRAELEEANNMNRGDVIAESTGPIGPADGGVVQLIKLVCISCNKYVSNTMMWPCRHVSLCTICDTLARVCPVCDGKKMMSFELGLPMP